MLEMKKKPQTSN